MKCLVKVLLVALIIVLSTILIKVSTDNRGIKSIKQQGYKINPVHIGLFGSRDFDFDEEGNLYVAYKNRVDIINPKGKVEKLFEKEDISIDFIEYSNKKLYFTSRFSLWCYDFTSKNSSLLIDNLPNFGDYRESRLLAVKDELFICIGAATNNAIVGEDNLWIKEYPYACDISPKDVIIKNPSNEKQNGAFVPFRSANYKLQTITGRTPGNASVIVMNVNSKNISNFAWGIRNVVGIDYDSQGKLYSAVGGMENRGSRNVEGDLDYIYILTKNQWYGWPDYSGGDPITSPRFKSTKGKLEFLLDKHPTSMPPAPLYQHNRVSSIENIAIDRTGVLNIKDGIYFFDKVTKSILLLDKNIVIREYKLPKQCEEIRSMKFSEEGLYFIESQCGTLYKLNKDEIVPSLMGEPKVMYYIIAALLVIVLLLLWKSNIIQINKK